MNEDFARKYRNVEESVEALRGSKFHRDRLRDLMIDITYYNEKIIQDHEGDAGEAFSKHELICLYHPLPEGTDVEQLGVSIYFPTRDIDNIYDVDPFERYGEEFVIAMAEQWLFYHSAKEEGRTEQAYKENTREVILDKLMNDFDIAHFYAKHVRIMAPTDEVAEQIARILNQHDVPDDHVFELSFDLSGKCYYLFNPNHDLDHVESIIDYNAVGLFELYTTFARLRQLAQ